VKALVPIIRLSTYYFGVGLAIFGLTLIAPVLTEMLPLGGSGNLTLDPEEFTTGKAVPVSWEPVSKALELAMGLAGAMIFMLPIAWIYMGARRRKGREQSFVLTLLMLPLAVAGIVIVVENSLALAFSLAGIVAGVRFRLTLDDTLDAIFIFMAIGVGLSSGIGALEIAAVLTAFFNYSLLILWQFNYAESASNTRWFSRTWMNTGTDEVTPDTSDDS